MKWCDIEQKARAKYDLSDEWHLCAFDAVDIEVIKVQLRKKGPRGGWLRGKDDVFDGYIVYSPR